MKLIQFLKVRENVEVICGNKPCNEPNKKIRFKHYKDHLVSCLKKDKCPNGCGAEIKSVEKANIHFTECKKCRVCL